MSFPKFEFSFSDAVLGDMRARLNRTRWPDEINDATWSLGTEQGFLRKFCHYWANAFDWRAHERRINTYPQFLADIDGLTIHFVHVRAEGGGLPLLIMNGWPSNFYECLTLADRLSLGTPHFDVVIPSLPGFGFSPEPQRSKIGVAATAAAFVKLMEGLGYPQFIVQGGDVGAAIAEQMRNVFPAHLIGLHITNLQAFHTVSLNPGREEQFYLEHRARWMIDEGGYIAIQRTRPQSLTYGLTDSPAGLAGWIIEKWRAWSDCAGDLETTFRLDDLCAMLTIYWATNTIGSSVRTYGHASGDIAAPVRKGPVPAGVAAFPKDNMPMVRARAEAWLKLIHYTEMLRGGHFPALEAPDAFAEDIRVFARRLADV